MRIDREGDGGADRQAEPDQRADLAKGQGGLRAGIVLAVQRAEEARAAWLVKLDPQMGAALETDGAAG